MNRTRWFSILSTVLLMHSTAHAYPADLRATRTLLPNPTADAAAGAPVDATGAATYSIPIPTAPNRNGLVPGLALTYSSRNPVRGGVAMGWSLGVPRIELDTSDGRMGPPRYRASNGGRLIRVDEPIEAGWEAYRGEHDASFTRYERKAGMPAEMWRARTPDGTVHFFGEHPLSKDVNHAGAAPDAFEGRWFLSRTVDHFGNEIRYLYLQAVGGLTSGAGSMPVDLVLSTIEYGANPGAGLGTHTRIFFEYATAPDLCPSSSVPIGARFDLRTGIPIYEGARRLTGVRLETRAAGGTMAPRRRLDLAYDTTELSCPIDRAHAPLRILTSVQETGFAPDGAPTALPPQTFTYNRLDRMFDVATPIAGGANLLGHGLAGASRSTYPNAGLGRPIAESMLLDLDGDARPDRLLLDDTNPASCGASWQRNVGGFTFAAAAPLGNLPIAPWANGSTRNPSLGERCSLTHQVSAVANRGDFQHALPATCTASPQPPQPPNDPISVHDSYRYVDWDRDGAMDLVSVIESRPDHYRPEHDPRVASAPTCACPGTVIAGFGCVHDSEDVCQRREEWACGQQVVRVHRGDGDGGFEAAETMLVPGMLDPEQDRDGLIESLMTDIDGDGRLDSVVYQGTPSNHVYAVQRNLGDNTFADPAVNLPLPVDKGFEQEMNWATGIPAGGYQNLTFAPAVAAQAMEQDAWVPIGGPPGLFFDFIHTTVRYAGNELVDVNGDGLPDLVSSRGTGLRAFYNHGAGFETHASLPEGDRGNLLTGLVTALESDIDKMFYRWDDPDQPNQGPYQKVGDFQGAVTRFVDFDGDGLRDLVEFSVPESVLDDQEVRLYPNLGDGFRDALNQHPVVERALEGLAHRLVETALGTAWHYETAFMDLDGDGLPEAIDSEGGTMVARSDSDTQPMRLLKAIDNGGGARVEYRYKAISGEDMPQPMWVVDRITQLPGAAATGTAPSMVTSFEHEDPVYAPDLEGEHAFRGFARSTVVSPTGARTVTSRSFEQSYNGLVSLVEVFGSDDRPLSRTSTTYEERRLFDADSFPGMVRTYHPTVNVTRTCKAGQSVIACAGAGDRSARETFYAPMAATGGPVQLHTVQWYREGSNSAGLPGTRGTFSSSTLRSSATQYLLTAGTDTTFLYTSPNVSVIEAQTAHYFDGTGRFEHWTSRWISGGTWAVTTRGFDTATGNLTLVVTPRFFAAGGPGTSLEYDADKRFVTATVNPLGHRVETTTDAATGVELAQRGPNVKNGVKDGWTRTVDGLGRERTRSVMIDDPTLGYTPDLVSQTSYVDVPGPRTRIVREQKIDVGGTRFAKTESEHDGLGRAVIERTYEGAFVRAETRRVHDARGLVTRIDVPRPGATGLVFSTWEHEYDELGRPLAMREPTRTGCTGPLSLSAPFAFCGKRWSYDGFATTIHDVTGTAGGEAGRKRETRDALGRLARSEVGLDGGAWAATVFTFDGRDHIVRVDSADGIATINTHDGHGRRTSVLRGANLWQFGYDPDGNLTSQISPIPAGGVQSNFTTSIVVDTLGRETSRTAAIRDWTAADEARFGTRTVLRSYDTGPNGIGRLASVNQSWGTVAYSYEARGLITAEQHSISVPDSSISQSRTLQRTYNAMGAVDLAIEADGATPATSTRLQTLYDDRGLSDALVWLNHGTVDEVGRGSDGRIVDRLLQDGAGIVAHGATTYDGVGRVATYTVVSRLPGGAMPSERAAQVYHHDGAGDVFQLDSRLSATSTPGSTAVSQYDYDSAHRLIEASGEEGYAATFSYSPGNRIIKADVDAGPGSARVHRRDVSYTYAAEVAGSLADPDAPLALSDAAPGDFVALTYDRAGNVATRVTTDGTFTHRHDGLDRQREVVNPDGTSERYYYDGSGQRTLIAHVNAGGNVERVTWNLGNTELRLDDSGAVERSTASGGLGGGAVRIVDQASTEHVFQDPRLHTLAVVGGDGGLRAGFAHGPYGELLREIGSASSVERERFNGKVFDAASGLSYYGFRYYDDRTLTWTQADPYFRFTVRADGGDTLYSFVGGNPIARVDLAGLQADEPIGPDGNIWIWDCNPLTTCLPQPAPEEDVVAAEMAKLLALMAIDRCRVFWCADKAFRESWKEAVRRQQVHILKSSMAVKVTLRDPLAFLNPNQAFVDFLSGAPLVSTAATFGDGNIFLSPSTLPGGAYYISPAPGMVTNAVGMAQLALNLAHEALHPTERQYADSSPWKAMANQPPDEHGYPTKNDEAQVRTMEKGLANLFGY